MRSIQIFTSCGILYTTFDFRTAANRDRLATNRDNPAAYRDCVRGWISICSRAVLICSRSEKYFQKVRKMFVHLVILNVQIKCSFLIYHYLSRKKMVTSLFLLRRQYRFVARRSRFVAGRKIKIKLGLKLANLLKSHIPSLGGIKFIAWTVMFVYKIFLRRSKRKLDAAISVKNYLKANVA